MVTVPVRVDGVVLADTRTLTLPFPVPEEPAVTISHVALLAALQMQPVPPLTATETLSPDGEAVRADGLIA